MKVTLKDIEHAAAALRGGVVETPCVHSRTLSQITGAQVFVKLENLQFTGSFKDRGALVKLCALGETERRRGVIAMSAGNHAQAVAYHAQRLGIPAVIVMPRFTPNVKVEHTRAFGAEVLLQGETFDDAAAYAVRIAEERGLCLVHPYDDPKIIAGQGTIALEMLAAQPGLQVLIVPVGGGGLVSGNAIAAKAVRPDIEVIGVETARFPSMHNALAGRPAGEPSGPTIADGIAVKQPGKLTLAIVRERVDAMLLVDEDEIEQAVLLLLEVEKTVAEGAGAVGLAALLRYRERFAGRKVGLVISGGNIDLPILSSIIQRGLVRTGRLVRLLVNVRDVPGALGDIAARIGRCGANIAEVHHHRTLMEIPLLFAEVELVLQTRGREHAREVIDALEAAGYAVHLPSQAAGSNPVRH